MRVLRCAALRSLRCGVLGIFFFSLHNSFRSLSPVPLLPTSSCPLSAPVPEQYLPQSSLCRLLDQVLQVPHLPPLKRGKPVFPSPGAGSGHCQTRLCLAPGRYSTIGKPGSRRTSFASFFVYSFGKLKCFTGFCWASDHCQQYSAASSDFPAPAARARTHTRLELRSSRPRGRWGRQERQQPRRRRLWPEPHAVPQKVPSAARKGLASGQQLAG